ncbi:MAG: histidine--tRNA ligase, partial [Clostridia bacterium]|nr:histidine--tRNA ligase [Clostridia bacterium]
GTDVPACGFSIGFERIVLLMQERGITFEKNKGIAVLVDKNLDKKSLVDVMDACRQMRKTHNVTIINRIKNLGYQLKQLAEQGIDEIYEYKNGAFNKIN